MEEKDRYMVDALADGLAVLRVFEASPDGLNLSEVAERLGWSRTKPYRFLHTLNRLGYLSRDEATKRYRPTTLTMTLGYAYFSGMSLVEVAQPTLNRLRDAVGASVHLGVKEGDDVVYIACARIAIMPTVHLHVGSRLPLHATSLGRILMAYLDDSEQAALIQAKPITARTDRSITDPARFKMLLEKARQDGYALTDQEFHEGVRSVAAPIFNHDGHVIAAVNATSIVHKFNDDVIKELVIPEVVAAASEISRGAGYMGQSSKV